MRKDLATNLTHFGSLYPLQSVGEYKELAFCKIALFAETTREVGNTKFYMYEFLSSASLN